MFNFRFQPSQTLEILFVDVLLLGDGVDLPLLLGVELVLAAPFGLWTAPNRLLTEPATLVEPALAAQRAAGAPLRVAALEGSERLRVQLPHVRLSPAASQVLTIRELLTPSSVSVRGVSSVWAFTGIDPARRTRIEAVRRASGLDELEQWRRLGAGLIIHSGAPSPRLEPLARRRHGRRSGSRR